MYSLLTVVLPTVFIASTILLIVYRNKRLSGELPQGLFPFLAILFTSGLDVGLIIFPLTEFSVYASEQPYQFTNPLAFMFGAWGFLIWVLYFFSTFYFCAIEPKVQIFEIPWVKTVNNLAIVSTCAFTAFLFTSYLPDYIDGISRASVYLLVGAVVLSAVYSSTDVRYVRGLSVSSTWVFYGLIVGVFFFSGLGLGDLGQSMVLLSDYFNHLPKFTYAVSDYHGFYLFWWFAWSIMIGQFVARFVGNLTTWQLFIALLIFPSIPIALWFSVLHLYYANDIEISATLNMVMVAVGILFVVNSLDSLTRLYTQNLKITVERFGRRNYIVLNWLLLCGLVLLYQFTPFKIEWVGMVVIGLYITTVVILFRKRAAWQLSQD